MYLDYASATPVLPEVNGVISETSRAFGNPGAIHHEGVEAKRLLLEAREAVALELGCKAREVIFVSGGTEANNLAILGFARKLETNAPRLNLGHRGPTSGVLSGTHWITSAIEHPSVLECFAEIERRGGRVTHVEPDAKGSIKPDSIARALRPETVFVSVQWANHEIGTIQPLREIAAALRAHETRHALRLNLRTILFHSDMGQAPLYLSPQVHGLGVDIATFDSGKLYGPRGIGLVYAHNRAELAPIIVGGGQERGLRAGTENVALASGFAKAFSIVARERHAESMRIRKLRDELARSVALSVPEAVINGSMSLPGRAGTTGGDPKHALPHILNISVPNISSEYVTLQMDRAGIAISTKSACREGEESRSHVVVALGGESWRASNTLRFSLGRDTTSTDIRHAADELRRITLNASIR